MEIFALDDEVIRWEGLLPSAVGLARLDLLVPLLWQLRQRDPVRARLLVQEAQVLMLELALPAAVVYQYQARINLACGEIHWFYGELELAEVLAQKALSEFTLLADAKGCADAYALQRWIAVLRGDLAAGMAALERSGEQARNAGDGIRLDMIEAQMATDAAFQDAAQALAHWGQRLNPDAAMPIAVAAVVHSFWAVLASLKSDFEVAVSSSVRAFHAALRTGQIYRAVMAAANASVSFNAMNDPQTALTWIQRGLDLARATGSSALIGQCLASLAATLQHLGQWDAAQQIVDEAYGQLHSIAGSRSYFLLLEIAGKLALAQGKAETAAALFQQVCDGGEQLKQIDIQIRGNIGLAQGRALQGQVQEAVQLLQLALELSVQHHRAIEKIEILQVLADLHTRYGLTLSAQGSESGSEPSFELSAALHYLHRALRVALSIVGYVVNPALYQALAHEYAQLRDFKMACEFALMAESARDKLHDQQVLSRANAMQIQFQTERMRAQALHHRKLAEAETLRAELIEENNRNLALMSEQEIRVEQAAREKAERATQSKSAFLAIMNHEIRTPLNAMLGIVQLAMQTELLPKQYDCLNKIHRSGVSILEIINDILDLSKIEAGQLALESMPFDLDEVLEDVARLTRTLANEKQISYLFDVPRAVPRRVCGDPLRLGQILRNLVLNALQNAEQGQIRLSCSVQQSDPQQVGLRFSVEDTGAGMDAEEAADLFSPLASSVSARRAGRTPLGLWVSFHLVRLMGAAFTAQSEPGHGSCFSFELILGRVAQVPAADLVWPCARLLLVSTDTREQHDLCDALHGLPLRIDCVDDTTQALNAVRLAINDPYHLLLINQHRSGADSSMDDSMGNNALAQRLQTEPGAPPILMLIESDLKFNPELHQPSVAAQVFKPIVLRNFLQQVYAVLVPSPDVPAIANTGTGQFQDARVLLVDDNEFNQEIGAELLAMQGIEVDIAKDGRQALDMLQIVGPDFYQLIFMDLEMPILDGHEATRILRQDERFNDVPIVAMTAHTTLEMQDRCFLNGMRDYIVKPIDPVLLNQVLARCLPTTQKL